MNSSSTAELATIYDFLLVTNRIYFYQCTLVTRGLSNGLSKEIREVLRDKTVLTKIVGEFVCTLVSSITMPINPRVGTYLEIILFNMTYWRRR